MRRTTLVLGLVAAVTAWCWSSSGPSGAASGSARPAVIGEEVEAGVEALLSLRISEVSAGTGDASLHPDAPAAVRERWRRGVTGFALLGLADYHEELTVPALDLTPPALIGSGGGSVYVVEVRRRWQIDSVDDHPATESVYLAVSPTPDGWRVLHDDPLRQVGLTSTRSLWEVADVVVVRDGGRVLVGNPDDQARMREVGGLLDRAAGVIGEMDVPDRYLVVVPAGAEQAKEFMQTPLDVSKFVAFVSFSIDRDDGWRAGPPRLVLQEGNLRRRSRDRQVFILAHELVHLTALDDAGPLTPLWVHEGYADWLANGRQPTGSGTLEIPEAHAFRSGSVSEIVDAYERSEALFGRLAELAGDDAPARFFALLGSVRSSAGTVSHHVDRALAGLSLDRDTLEGRSSEPATGDR